MVLIHDFICIERPVTRVVALLDTKESWLVPLASSAYQEGESLLGGDRPVGPGVLTKRVHMTVGPSRSRADSLVVPIRWEATGLRGLFPVRRPTWTSPRWEEPPPSSACRAATPRPSTGWAPASTAWCSTG